MTSTQKIRLRLSQVRQRLNEISGLEDDAFTDEIRAEAATLQTEYADLETRPPSCDRRRRRGRDATDRGPGRRGARAPRASIPREPHDLPSGRAIRSPGGRPRGRATGGGRDRRRDPDGIVGRPERGPGDPRGRRDGGAGYRWCEPGPDPPGGVLGFDRAPARHRTAARCVRVLRKRRRSQRA